MRHRAAAASIISVLVALALGACGEDHCSEQPTDSTDAPVLRSFELRDQLDADPWSLVFAATFEDADGDLSQGSGVFYLNGAESGSRVEFPQVFQQSGVAPDASSGVLAIPLRFSDTVQDGARVWIGMQLRDQASNISNCYALRLDFDVRQAAQNMLSGVQLRLARWWSDTAAAAAFEDEDT